MTEEIHNGLDLIDSRQVMARVEELTSQHDEYHNAEEGVTWTDEDQAELITLEALVKQGEALEDWVHGVTLVRYSYFTEYARDYAHDLEYVKGDNPLLDHIDWESWADALHQEYTELDFNGVEYFAR